MSAQPGSPTMATPTTIPSAPAASSSTGKAAAKAVSTCLSSAGQSVFNMPVGITLPQFDGMEWHQWAGILEALLTLHEAASEKIISSYSCLFLSYPQNKRFK